MQGNILQRHCSSWAQAKLDKSQVIQHLDTSRFKIYSMSHTCRECQCLGACTLTGLWQLKQQAVPQSQNGFSHFSIKASATQASSCWKTLAWRTYCTFMTSCPAYLSSWHNTPVIYLGAIPQYANARIANSMVAVIYKIMSTGLLALICLIHTTCRQCSL